MTRSTDDLIRRLSRDLQGAPSLGRPLLRAIAWTTGAAIYVALVVTWMVPLDAVMSRWSDLSFSVQQVAALATALTAAAAALSMTIPGRGRLAVVPIVAAGTWLSLLLLGCLQDWTAAGSAGLAVRDDWGCVTGIPLMAAVPGIALAVMLRRGAPLQPRATTALGALSVASLASLGMCAAQPHERDVIILVWHGATIAVVSALAAMAGGLVLNWKHRSLTAP